MFAILSSSESEADERERAHERADEGYDSDDLFGSSASETSESGADEQEENEYPLANVQALERYLARTFTDYQPRQVYTSSGSSGSDLLVFDTVADEEGEEGHTGADGSTTMTMSVDSVPEGKRKRQAGTRLT